MTFSNVIKSNLRRYGRRMTIRFPDKTVRRQYALLWRTGQKNFSSLIGGYSVLGEADEERFHLICPPGEGGKALEKRCIVEDRGERYLVLHTDTIMAGCETCYLTASLRKLHGEESV